jgi:hypothetical protein
MSALPPKADMFSTVAMSALGQKQTHALQQSLPVLGEVLPYFCQ